MADSQQKRRRPNVLRDVCLFLIERFPGPGWAGYFPNLGCRNALGISLFELHTHIKQQNSSFQGKPIGSPWFSSTSWVTSTSRIAGSIRTIGSSVQQNEYKYCTCFYKGHDTCSIFYSSFEDRSANLDSFNFQYSTPRSRSSLLPGPEKPHLE